MHGKPSDLVVEHLAFPRVEANPHLQANFAHAVPDRTRAADRPRRAIEGGKEAVTGRIHFPAAELTQATTDELVMGFQEFAPGTITESGSSARCVDDVREENGGEDSLGLH